MHRRAAHAVPHQGRFVAVSTGIVRLPLPDVGRGREAGQPLPFVIGARVRVRGRGGPAALLQANHLQPRLRQPQRRHRAAHPGTDDHHIDRIEPAHARSLPVGRSRSARLEISIRSTMSVHLKKPRGTIGRSNPGVKLNGFSSYPSGCGASL